VSEDTIASRVAVLESQVDTATEQLRVLASLVGGHAVLTDNQTRLDREMADVERECEDLRAAVAKERLDRERENAARDRAATDKENSKRWNTRTLGIAAFVAAMTLVGVLIGLLTLLSGTHGGHG
jgi:hypothetical protein